jgi:hypothetical protein
MRPLLIAGWSSLVARQAHNLKVAGSNPAPATKLKSLIPRIFRLHSEWLRNSHLCRQMQAKVAKMNDFWHEFWHE